MDLCDGGVALLAKNIIPGLFEENSQLFCAASLSVSRNAAPPLRAAGYAILDPDPAAVAGHEHPADREAEALAALLGLPLLEPGKDGFLRLVREPGAGSSTRR